MTLSDWVDESRYKLDRHGALRGGKSAAYDLWGGALRRLFDSFGLDGGGTDVFAMDWDVLLILDTCRPDVLAEVAPEYDFLTGYDPDDDVLRSVGSTSFEWMEKTFGRRHDDALSRTAYVCANGHASKFGDALPDVADEFAAFDRVWEYGWDDDYGCVPPRVVTDRTISTAREARCERVVAHYMQPHAPYRSLDAVERHGSADRGGERTSVWSLLQAGVIDPAEAWAAYRNNLRWVLDDLELLLDNLDAERVVVTSDHGEAFGEWGLYGHYRHVPAPELRRVPWVTVPAEDRDTYRPDEYETRRDADVPEAEVTDRLRQLGYQE